MIVGIPRESYPGERRVALIPMTIPSLTRAGLEVLVEQGAGQEAGFTDAAYVEHGAKLASSRQEVYGSADVLAQVRSYGANPLEGRDDLELTREGQAIVGFFEPFTALDAAKQVAARGATQFAMELVPRITRAQSMDALSSMASLAGYKAVLLAANHLPKIFPMMMTAAGTISAAKVFIIGVGVAGLQAIATARRLGAVVHAYDVRPEVKEQVLSLGARFVEMELDTAEAQDTGGYAKALGEEFYKKQRELMGRTVAESDAVITTAAVPGRKAPILVTSAMVDEMAPGSVIVDLAAERGGNCELTQPGEVAQVKGVTLVGPLNIPASLPYHASQMYSKNVATFLLHVAKEGKLHLDLEDQITRDMLVAKDGEVVHPKIKEMLGADPDNKES